MGRGVSHKQPPASGKRLSFFRTLSTPVQQLASELVYEYSVAGSLLLACKKLLYTVLVYHHLILIWIVKKWLCTCRSSQATFLLLLNVQVVF